MKHTHVAICLFLGLAAGTSVATAGWPFTADGPKRGTPEWYEATACDPVGTRQRYMHGKMWPPQPRPCGPDQKCVHIYHTAHYWPYPYNCADRSVVHQVMDTQVHNGWSQATVLYEYHFDPVTQELNSAGQRHLQWIMVNVPDEHRQLTLAASGHREFDSARLISVQREASLIGGANHNLAIRETRLTPTGRSASEIDTIMTKYAASVPPPQVTYTGVNSTK